MNKIDGIITNNNIDSSKKGDNKKITNSNNNITKSKNSNKESSNLIVDTSKINKDKIEKEDSKYIDMNVIFKKFLTSYFINDSSIYPEIKGTILS